MSILLSEGPDDALVQLLDVHVTLLGDLGDDRVDGLALFVLFLALDDFLRGDSSFGQVDVSCRDRGERMYIECVSFNLVLFKMGVEVLPSLTLVGVDPHDDDNLIPSDPDELLYRSDTSSRQFGKQDHSLDVVVLELSRQTHKTRTLGEANEP